MSDIAAQIIASSKIISSPTGEAAAGFAKKEPAIVGEVNNIPIAADVLGLGQFFGPNASEVCPPDMLASIKSKMDSVVEFVRENITTYSDQSVKDFILKLSAENNWDKLKPADKLDRFYDYIDLKKRLSERKNIDTIIKNLKDSLYA